MDQPHKKNKKGKKNPRVPIKTYRWEDVRRSRRKGGYPWTYLYKQPFHEELNIEPYTMEALRKSKSASTLGNSEGVDIFDVTSEPTRESFGTFLGVPEKMDNLQIITEPDDHSIKNSAGSLVIEECDMSDAGSHKPENVGLESADSSDNISQYLDKEESGPEVQNLEDCRTRAQENNENETEENQSTKFEESKRKRKLSGESKISLTKNAMLKKIKDTRNKIKVPKLTFPTSKLKKSVPKRIKNSPPELKKDTKKLNTESKISKPVYIHIPLKPPPGQTDEFSYLEFEEKSNKKPRQIKKLGSFKDVVKNIKQLQEVKADGEQKTLEANIPAKIVEENNEPAPKLGNKGSENLDSEKKETNLESEMEVDQTLSKLENKQLPHSKSESQGEPPISKDNKDEQKGSKVNRQQANDNKILAPTGNTEDPNSANELPEEVGNKNRRDMTDTNGESESNATPAEDKNANDFFDKLFETRASASSSRENEAELSRAKNVRSKSAEPERRRKLSLESSYSRKSLSKLGILKKLKETTDKIKNSLSRSNSKKQPKEKEQVEKKEVPIPKKLKPPKSVEPVYIHIPLKPPEGQTDEFSYLEFEDKPSSQDEKNKRTSSSPDSPLKSDGVQFIILTAPSDDEILDYHSSDAPETPSSENKLFFSKEDLKELAKDIVDEISSINKKLDTVNEETASDKIVIEEIDGNIEVSVQPTSENNKNIEKEKMMVDEEDGLNESVKKQELTVDTNLEAKEGTATDQPVELKSNLKGECSPVIKKKVSFRRRSKPPKDGIYEDIQIPKQTTDADKAPDKEKRQLSASGTSQSMSVDEEKTYLDEKIIKANSLEEDYNKWSKISDHEYEPINPPPDNETFPPSTDTVHTVDSNQEFKRLPPISSDGGATNISVHIKDETNLKSNPTLPLQRVTDVNDPTLAFPSVGNEQTHTQELDSSTTEKAKDGPSKFQLALKQTTDQFKSKLHNIKKPHITIPDKAKFRKFKIEKPKFNFPKIPDTAKVNLPSFHLPRRNSAKRSLKERQLSTESNDGDSKKPIFDFSTYPRIFKKKPKTTVEQKEENNQNFATVPRVSRKTTSTSNKSETAVKWGVNDTVRISPSSEERINIEYNEEPVTTDLQQEADDNREDSLERKMSSHIRYEQDIYIEDEYDRENNEINKEEYLRRWDYGSFNPDLDQDFMQNYKNSHYKVTDLDSPEEIPDKNYDYNSNNNSNNNKEHFSSGSSLGVQRIGGVLEEIDSDEFFLRQKGISQDNIEVGMLLSTEIREAFRTPENALSKIKDREYDPRGSNQSLPETQTKRKPIKKPKRKKTPHASQEKIPYAEESGDDDLDTLPPSRPRRRSKRTKKPKYSGDVVPYQETISLDTNNSDARLFEHRESLGILGDDEQETETNIMYENELMEGKEQPEIKITDPYKNFEFVNVRKYRQNSNENENPEEQPAAPPRKPKSLRSLNLSENDSILEDLHSNKDIAELENEIIKSDMESVPQVSKEPPQRPSRMRSMTSSQSIINSQLDDESLSRRTESFTSENQIPCVEEPCVQDLRDYMGYAIIDKQKVKDPPLPPPRIPSRSKRSITSNSSSDTKFFTVPRPTKDSDTPVRPLRNYSTLGQARRSNEAVTYENKENIDITQYIEIEDEPNRDLQSGEIIKKMKDRPLPAPPRPPRKSRPLRDITSEENIMIESTNDLNDKLSLEETEVSTQTEPLPDDFVCEEVTQEASDTILTPSAVKISDQSSLLEKHTPLVEQQNFLVQKQIPSVEKHLITPSYFTHEETITHGSLIVQLLNGDKILPDSELTHLSKEKIIPITTESDCDTSSIPEDFKKLKDPSEENVNQEQVTTASPAVQNINTDMDVLRAQKLQVSDLDVDTLTVNKLLAGKIIVSEIDSSSIQAYEISSKSGALKVGEIELPPGIIQEILKAIRSDADQSIKPEETTANRQIEKNIALDQDDTVEQKKTSITNLMDSEVSPQPAEIFSDNENSLVETKNCTHLTTVYEESKRLEHHTDSFEPEINNEIQHESSQIAHSLPNSENLEKTMEYVTEPQPTDEYPQRPPRQSEKLKCDFGSSHDETLQEPDVDDEPPPRPPEPQLEYLPSQPPPSFYALKAQKYVDTCNDNIPAVPRRRRQTKSKPISRSSSEDSTVAPVARRFHNRSEASITQLSSQLLRACGTAANSALKRLITNVTYYVLENADGKQDLHVMMVILLVLIAGLILLGYGDEKTVIHLHHWEYFNPPRDM